MHHVVRTGGGTRAVKLAAIAALAIAVAAFATPVVRAPSPDLAALDQYVVHAVRDWHVPGLAIAVVKDDSLVFAKGYGVIETGQPAPVTEHTRFGIASTTKAMTVAALAMMVDEGKLRWDDRVIDHLPNFRLYDPYVTREFTIRDLLTHRSGLPNMDLLWARGDYKFPEIMRRLRYAKPATSFRSEFEYQNVMYAVAGAVLEQASGMPWDVFIQKRILTPLGMTETAPLGAKIMGQSDVARPHDFIDGTIHVLPYDPKDEVAPAGAVWSSVSDMSKWMRFMLDSGRIGTKRLIQPATFREIVAPEIRAPMTEYPALELARPHFFSYALGWFVQEYHGETVWMHTGSIDGLCAIIGLIPAKRVGVYVLENRDHAELRHALMYKVFDLYDKSSRSSPRDWSADVKALFDKRPADEAPLQHAKGTHPSFPLDSYTGTYSDSVYGEVKVTLAKGALRLQFANSAPDDLEHWDHDRFRGLGGSPLEPPPLASFSSDGAGDVSAVQLFGVTFLRSPNGAQKD